MILSDHDKGSPTLHVIESFNPPTSHKMVILSLMGAEIAGVGGRFSSPSRARNSEPHSRARVKGHRSVVVTIFLLSFPTPDFPSVTAPDHIIELQ